LKIIILRFAFSAILLSILTYYYFPDLFLRFPTQRPQLWLLVMMLYPILSAYPQEIISRVFFFQRYAHLFPNIKLLILLNAILFAWMHILFGNWIAIILSFIGGLFFAQTYYKTRSLLLVTIEHLLYGNFLFTIGLGWFFYHGNQLG
jgi:membrane protease YdiL (CAAX protease family)